MRPFDARIRYGAIKVPLPNVQQFKAYTCGAAAFQAVCSYFGVGPDDPDDYAKILGTKATTGTKPKKFIEWAQRFGLRSCLVEKMTIQELKDHLNTGQPVICSMQAYGDTPKRREQYTAKSNGKYVDRDGHYIVAIGYDDENVYFEDPSLAGRRGFIPIKEFDGRWHDNDSGHKVHLGVVIWANDLDDPAYMRKAMYIP